MPDKRDVLRQNVWCIADMDTDEYNTLEEISLAQIPWASQQSYGHDMVYFYVVIIALFIIKRLMNIFVDNSSKLSKTNFNLFKICYYKVAAFNRYFSYRRFPAIVCDLFAFPSSFGNFLIIIAGCLYILCYTFIPKFWYRACLGFGSPPLSVRACLEATALVPLLFILSGKTNLISQLAGISYEKINVYHRWTSFACCFLGWVHAIPFFVQAIREDGNTGKTYLQQITGMVNNGLPVLVFLTMLTIFSHAYFRKYWYEGFIHIHWICALGFYISLFYHSYLSLDGWKYLIATIIFWMTQLIWRAVTKSMLRPNNGFLRPNNCKMRRYTSSNDKDHYFEIIIENSFDFSWVPGQHVFIRIPDFRVLDNHPFSIISNFKPPQDNEIKLIVKAVGKFGLTKTLYNKLPDTGYLESRVFLDGPYGGCERPCDAFNNVYLVSSGTGISAVFPFLIDCTNKMKHEDSIIERIRFDWIIRSSDNIEWIASELRNIVDDSVEYLKQDKIQINIYFKDEVSDIEPLSQLLPDCNNSSSENVDKESAYMTLINLVNKTSNISEIMEEIRLTLGNRNIFVVSGSGSVKVEISNKVASLQKEVFKNSAVQEVYLYSETFGW